MCWAISLIGGGLLGFIQQRLSDRPTAIPSHSPLREDFTKVPNIPTGLFAYGGSAAWAPIRLIADSAIQAQRREFQLRYVQPRQQPVGSSTGITMLLEGRIAFAQSARPILREEAAQAEQQGFKLQQVPVALDGIAVAVHPSLNIPGLTIEQLQKIYSGEITNWRELGGNDLEIQLYSSPLSSGGTVEFFLEDILKGQQFSNRVEYIATPTEAFRRLENTPGGIYFSSAATVVPQCSVKPLPLGHNAKEWVSPYMGALVAEQECPGRRNQLNTEAFYSRKYPLTHFLYVIEKHNGQIEQTVGEAYTSFLLTTQGQTLIQQAGFVPIR